MEIRGFYGEEIREYKEQSAVLFHNPNFARNIDEDIEKDKARKDGFVRLGAFEKGFLAAIEMYPYEVYFDGKKVKMSGIGGVISSLNARGNGVMEEIFKHACKTMRETGVCISHLFPFRGDYYRKLGYEVTAEEVKWSIPTEFIIKEKPGEIKIYDASEAMKNDIIEIYHAFASKFNLMRTDYEWDKYFENITPYTSDGFNYLHYTAGNCDGYLSYSMTPYPNIERKRQDISVSHFWYKNSAGISGMLNYLLGLKDYSDRCIIPCNDDLSSYVEFNGGWGKRNTERRVDFCGSSRIIDVERILELKDFKGTICIKIYDELCPWNDSVFTLSDGIVTKSETGDVDAEMNIRAFSSLIMGRYSKPELAREIKILKNYDSLKNLFAKRDIWFDGHF